MATKTYTLAQEWYSGTTDKFTFSLPDDKPADYQMTIELDNGTKATQTISVGTAPHTYTISATPTNSTSALTASFTTPACVYEEADFKVFYNPVYPKGKGTIWTDIINHNVFRVKYTVYYFAKNLNDVVSVYGSDEGYLSANSGGTQQHTYYNGTSPTLLVEVNFKDSIDGVEKSTQQASLTLKKYKVNYPAMPENVTAFQIYSVSAETSYPLITSQNLTSAGYIEVNAGSQIYAEITTSDGYVVKSVNGISIDADNPTIVGEDNADITISDIILEEADTSVSVLFPAVTRLSTSIGMGSVTKGYTFSNSKTDTYSGYSNYSECTIDGITVGTSYTTIKTNVISSTILEKTSVVYSAKFVDGVLTVRTQSIYWINGSDYQSGVTYIVPSASSYSTTALFSGNRLHVPIFEDLHFDIDGDTHDYLYFTLENTNDISVVCEGELTDSETGDICGAFSIDIDGRDVITSIVDFSTSLKSGELEAYFYADSNESDYVNYNFPDKLLEPTNLKTDWEQDETTITFTNNNDVEVNCHIMIYDNDGDLYDSAYMYVGGLSDGEYIVSMSSSMVNDGYIVKMHFANPGYLNSNTVSYQ